MSIVRTARELLAARAGWVRTYARHTGALPIARREPRSVVMPKYLISFPDGAMSFPLEDLPAVVESSHAVVQEAKDAGVFVFAGGLDEQVAPVLVGEDGSVSQGTYPQSRDFGGGFTVIDVATREEALEWAAKFAAGCRCAQELREFMVDPLE